MRKPTSSASSQSRTTRVWVVVEYESLAGNTPPVATNNSYTTDEDTQLNTGNLIVDDTGDGADSDVDGDPLMASKVSDPSNGSASVNGDGTFTYDPTADYCGSDSFTYKVNDGLADSNTATVSITVTCVDDPPVAVDDPATLTEDDPAATIDVLANDTDIDGGPISIDSVDTTGTTGAVVITNSGADLTYEPPADYCNSGSPIAVAFTNDFTYTLTPGGPTATVSVTVTCVNDPPVITSVSPASQTANYSDYIGQVTISACDIDTPTSIQDLSLSQTGAPSAIPTPALNSTASCSDSGLGQTCTWTMDGQVLTAGTNVLDIDFTASDGTDSSDCVSDPTVCRHVLTVEPEDATVESEENNEVCLPASGAPTCRAARC